jgi:hypothetical protein
MQTRKPGSFKCIFLYLEAICTILFFGSNITIFVFIVFTAVWDSNTLPNVFNSIMKVAVTH